MTWLLDCSSYCVDRIKSSRLVRTLSNRVSVRRRVFWCGSQERAMSSPSSWENYNYWRTIERRVSIDECSNNDDPRCGQNNRRSSSIVEDGSLNLMLFCVFFFIFSYFCYRLRWIKMYIMIHISLFHHFTGSRTILKKHRTEIHRLESHTENEPHTWPWQISNQILVTWQTYMSDRAYLCKNFNFLLTITSDTSQQSNIFIHSAAVSVQATKRFSWSCKLGLLHSSKTRRWANLRPIKYNG